MLIKDADDKSAHIAMLEQLLAHAANGQRKSIEIELRNLRAGIKAEKDAAYLIDFSFRDTKNWAVIHDLRIEVNDRVAQIDHLLISRFLEIYVLETKGFHAGLKITNDGEFLRWNDYRKTYEGMPSPIAQNERHTRVLKNLLNQLSMPTRMGFRLEPTITPLVLVSANSRIDRPREFDTSCVIKADVLEATVMREMDEKGALGLLASAAKIVSPETLDELAKAIAAQHRPASFDYAARFGFDPTQTRGSKQSRFGPAVARAASTAPGKPTTLAAAKPSAAAQSTQPESAQRCRHCESTQLFIAYGKYGYYFKCTACSGNTPIKLGCGHASHRERLRKERRRFYRECADCQTSTLFFENPAETGLEESAARG